MSSEEVPKNLYPDLKNFDSYNENFRELKLKDFETLLIDLKNAEPSDISSSYKIKLSCLNEQLNHLLMIWEFKNSTFNNDNTKNIKIQDDLWDGNFILKYLFEDYIQYSKSVSKPDLLPQLYCNICKINFTCNSKILLLHLQKKEHLNNFDKIKNILFLNNNCKFWNDTSILKILNENFIIMKQLSNKFYCKICCIYINSTKFHLIEHLESDKHLKHIKGIIDFNLEFDKILITDEIKKTFIELPVSDDIALQKCDIKDCTSLDTKNNDLIIFKIHDEFMLQLYKCFLYNKYNPVFCQPCCYYHCNINLKGRPDKLTHETSLEHKNIIDKINLNDLINYEWKFCNFCHCFIYCNDKFFKRHLTHNLHKSIKHGKMYGKNNDKGNNITNVKHDDSNKKNSCYKKSNEKDNIPNKNIRINENNDGLKLNIKILIETLLNNSNIDKNNHFFGFYCYLCNYWCIDDDLWRKHIFSEQHNCIIINTNHHVKICDCKIIMICDNEKFIEHQSSVEHVSLKRFILNKLSTNIINPDKHISTDKYKKDKDHKYENSDNDSDDSDFDSESETSSVTSTFSSTSIRSSQSSLCSDYSYNETKKGNKAISKTSFNKTKSYGIKGKLNLYF